MTETVRVEKAIANQSPDAVFAFVVDVENYSTLMPNVNRVQILEQSEEHRITHWDTEIERAPLIWTEKDTILTATLRIEFDCIEGDFEVFRGNWEVIRPDTGGPVRVACELEYSVGIPVIEDIVGPLLRQKITENLETMLAGIAQGIGARSRPSRLRTV
jgi:ribosome-associated toxin RatA of RatAB toxin-antitoxin module